MIINGYNIIEKIYKDIKKSVYRAEKDGKVVIMKVLDGTDISEEKIKEMQYEFEVLNMIAGKGAVMPIEIIKNNLNYAIVFEFFSGIKFDEIDFKKWNLEKKLKLMYNMFDVIEKIHNKEIVHKNINPATILYDENSDEIKMLEFGNAAILSKEKIIIPKGNIKEREINYISPEQTGRTNRSIDYRTDYYSIGAVFYEILSGEKLFKDAITPIEIIYRHIAKEPTPIKVINSAIPETVSDIVDRLLSKNSESRYQTSAGIKDDLKKCIDMLKTDGNIIKFKLGESDRKGMLNLDEIESLRKKEKKIIEGVYEKVASGEFEIIGISGVTGSGKSTLIKNIETETVKKCGRVAIGKFDKYKKNIPYNGLTDAFKYVIKQIMSESEENITKVKESILKSIGNNGKVITELFPEMEFIIGKQNELEKLSPIESQNRFNFTFINFLNSISSSESPLVLCLDNCNWADAASIDFLKKISERKNMEYIMIVLIYKENIEEESEEDFIKVVNEIDEKHLGIVNIKLEPLNIEEVKEFMETIFGNNMEEQEKFCNNIYKITYGIPIYIKQYIEIMYKRNIVSFDTKSSIWRWNENEILSLDIGKDISNLILNKIRECSKNCEIMLRRAAIIGRKFDYKKIAQLTSFDNERLTSCLWEAIKEKIIEPIDFEFEMEKNEIENPQFKYCNDKFYQVLYSNIEEKLKKAIHEKLGRLILEDGEIEENIFEILYHLNLSRELINEKKKQIELSELNFKAGNKAKKSSAFKEALKYYEISEELLNVEEKYDKEDLYKIELYSEAAEAAYSCGEYDKMEKYAEYVINSKIDVVDKTNVYVVKILAFLAKGNSKGAVEFAIEVLKNYGVFISKDITKTKVLLKILEEKIKMSFKNIDKFSELPKMENKRIKSVMRILTTVSSSAYLSYPELFIIIVLKQLELSLKYGNSIESPFAYCMYGVLLCGVFKEIEKGYRYGKIAMKISEKFGKNEYTGKSSTVCNLFITHWKEEPNIVLRNFIKAQENALEFGDVEYAAWALLCNGIHSFFAGNNLKELKMELMDSADKIKNEYKQEKQYDTIKSFIKIADRLIINEKVDKYENTKNDEVDIKKYSLIGDNNGLYYLYSGNLILSLFLSEYAKGIEYSEKAGKNMQNVISTINFPEYYFYSALCYIKEYERLNSSQKKIFYQMYKKIKKYGELNSYTHRYKYYLLTAEIKRINNDKEAMKYYEMAGAEAVKNGFIQDGAVANELTADYYIKNNMVKIGEYYLESSYNLYKKWGANKKCIDMAEKYPKLLYNENHIEKDRGDSIEMVDTIGIIKIAQLLSKEVKYEKLISKIIDVVMENAGAEKCKIFIKDSKELVLEAEADINSDKKSNIGKKYEDVKEEVAENIINYVYRTGESVVVNDAVNETVYSEDVYIKKMKPKSILCIPIVVQNKTIGIMYFENNLTTWAFMSERVETLKIIASQSAISLENIKMYEKLEDKVKERTEELMEINKKLEIKNIELEEAKNIANKAALIKTEFLANMSHEIRTPMNGVIGLTHLIKKTNLNQQQNNYVLKIEESAKYLLGIINDILDFSKLEAGKIEIDSESFSIENVFSYISSMIMKSCEDKGVELFFKLSSKIPAFVVGDEMRLKQVLTNLVGNAAKFTQSGEIVVQAEIEREEDEKVILKFRVKDTGIGMTFEEKKKLFQAFTQADSSISRKFGGTGLGLVISKTLVELMGGKIWFESETGVGSIFYFTVELKKGIFNKEIIENTVIVKNNRALIIDDSEISLEILEEYLNSFGVQVEKANSGKDGIEKIKNSKFDLIIIDWKMPDLNGVETIKRIKADLKPEDIPAIIMVSAYNIDEIKEHGKAAGINGFLTKPVHKSTLYDSIAKILYNKNKEHKDKEEKIEMFNWENILLVEDNKINQMVAIEFLNAFKLKTTLAENGRDAIELIKENKFSLVLMDVQMPEMDGYEATKIIKFENGVIPIIAMTANSMEGDKEKCYSAGMDDYISKPINPEELNKKLSKWIKNGRNNKLNSEKKEFNFKFSGIDKNSEIIRVAGEETYLEIFKEFYQSYKDIEIVLRSMYKNNEEDRLKKYIHSLKSASGNIGAVNLSKYAIKMEEKIFKKEDVLEELNDIIREFKVIEENILK